MSAIKFVETAGEDVTVETLELAPARLLTFVECLGQNPAISGPMTSVGWSDALMKEGYGLLHELRTTSKPARTPAPLPHGVASDIASCEHYQATGMVRIRAFLEPTHPEQAAFLFHDFTAGKGAAAVLNVATFLERLRALENSPERKASRKQDRLALQLVAVSGTTKETLNKLARSVASVLSTTAAAELTPEEVEHARVVEERRVVVLRKIYAFITLWSQVARTVLTQRSSLIQLGIAKRRPKKKVATPAPAPVVTAPPAGGDAPKITDDAPNSRAA